MQAATQNTDVSATTLGLSTTDNYIYKQLKQKVSNVDNRK